MDTNENQPNEPTTSQNMHYEFVFFNIALANDILAFCERHRLSVYEFSVLADVAPATVHSWIRFEHVPSIDCLLRVCAAMQISPAMYFDAWDKQSDDIDTSEGKA
jgi:hypothetical protein